MLRAALLTLALAAPPAAAETLVAAATIRANTVIGAEHLTRSPETVAGALSDPAKAIGKEARVVLYAGRPIRAADLGPPALVERNQIVTLIFFGGGLSIATDGRALDRAGVGETVRALNMSSRSTVTGTVDRMGRILVGGSMHSMERP